MKALLLCASHNDLGLVRSLRKLGYEIIAIGKISGLIGEKFVDEYIQLDYSDKEAVLKLAKEKEIDAICQCCNDFGVYTAAYVAEKLGLPGYDSYETTLLLHNKDLFKKFALENEILTCRSFSFENEEEAVQWTDSAEFPLIVKPSDASAGNGIHKIESKTDARKYIEQAFDKSRNGRIIIEPYLSGTQHGFCTFLRNQKVVAWCSNDEYSMINPYRVEIDTYPASDYKEVYRILIGQIEKMAGILNLKDGIFHLQYMDVDGKPFILEVMRRILGNMYSVPASLLNNFDWDYWETRARCGLSLAGMPQTVCQEGFYAYKTIMGTANGTIREIQIPKEYEKFLIGQCLLKQAGDEIQNYMSQPIGFLFFMFSSEEEMLRVLVEQYDNSFVKVG